MSLNLNPRQPSVDMTRMTKWVIAFALRGKADVLLTGDKDMLVLKRVGGMPIHSPRAFWEYLKKA